ncbi:MAG: hypothetical protein IPP25_03220 [Saprospiraceae bacterium]|nr:hypothetical protein [Candidatus Opimibacter skivensis]
MTILKINNSRSILPGVQRDREQFMWKRCSTIVSDGGLAPVVALGNDILICTETQLYYLLFFKRHTWLWQDGSVTLLYDYPFRHRSHVAVSNSCGAAYDTLVTNLLAATPPLDLGADTYLSGRVFYTNHQRAGCKYSLVRWLQQSWFNPEWFRLDYCNHLQQLRPIV